MPRIVVNLRDALTIYKYVGDQVYDQGGYILLWDKAEGRYFSEHRLVVERALGRRLRTEEEVHHVNGKRQDNSPGNLVVCDPEYHKYLDALMRLRRGGLTLRARLRQFLVIERFLSTRSGHVSSSDLRRIQKKIRAYISRRGIGSATPKSRGQSPADRKPRKSK